VRIESICALLTDALTEALVSSANRPALSMASSVVSSTGLTMKIPIAATIATVVTILMIGLMTVPAPINGFPDRQRRPRWRRPDDAVVTANRALCVARC
jgi:hypothetical protein